MGNGLRVVVTGASGNVGTSVVEALSADPAVERILGIVRRQLEWTVPKTEWALADVAKDDLGYLLRGADVVIHLAWLFQPTHEPVTTWEPAGTTEARSPGLPTQSGPARAVPFAVE